MFRFFCLLVLLLLFTFALDLLEVNAVFDDVIESPIISSVSSPDEVNVSYIKAFRSVHEQGDILFVCRYFLNYYNEPEETADKLFIFAIVTIDGRIIKQRKLPEDGYGHNVQTYYFSALEAESITWRGAYRAVIMGNPSIFIINPDDSRAYLDMNAQNDWSPVSGVATLTAGQINLKDGIIAVSKRLDILDSSLLLVSTSDSSGSRLTDKGRIFWEERYSGVTEIPNLLYAGVQYITVDNQTYTGSYFNEISLMTNVSEMKENFANLGDAVGIPYWQVIAFVVLCIPTFVIISSTVYQISGNSKVAAVVAAPMMFVITMLIPDAMLMILTAILAFIVVVVMWRFV